jgi:hypothetical protein
MAGSPELCESFSRLATRWPFNRYGMVSGHVETISPDAAELPDTRERDRKDTRSHVMPPSGFRTLVARWIRLTSSATANNSGSQPACSSPPKSISAAARLWNICSRRCRRSRTKPGER